MAWPSSGGSSSGGAAAGNSSSSGGKGGPNSYPMLYGKRTATNEEQMKYFAAALCGLLGIFVLFHLGRVLAQKTGFASKVPIVAVPFLHASRAVRHVLIRKIKFMPSGGHGLLAFVYVSINIIIMFTNMDNSVLPMHTNIAARTGWMAISNLVVVVFLSLKNTPLGYLTAWSYERINALHQIAGYTLMSLIIIHSSSYSSYFLGMGNVVRMQAKEEIFGIVAGFCVLTLVLAGSVIRRFWYELFYVIHVLFFICGITFIGLHQPDPAKKLLIATCFAGAMWGADRVLRFCRLVAYSVNNNATVHPLPHGGTRIVLKKTPLGASSGDHCFLWIPGVRLLEMHPFTISAVGPLEFVVASYDGFTRDLHKYAVDHPGATLRASTEGPYGRFPDSTAYDKVVFIGGGSGGSFTFGMALDLLKKMKPESTQQLVFLWIVKDHAQLSWFKNHIQTLRSGQNTTIALHVTRANTPSLALADAAVTAPPMAQTRTRASSVTTTTSSPPLATSSEKADAEHTETATTETTETTSPKQQPARPPKVKTTGLTDPEKSGVDSSTPSTPVQEHEVAESIEGVPVLYSRPDVSAVIRGVVDTATPDQRVLVIGCGPDGLMAEVRNTTASLIRPAGPGLELHCEQFGW